MTGPAKGTEYDRRSTQLQRIWLKHYLKNGQVASDAYEAAMIEIDPEGTAARKAEHGDRWRSVCGGSGFRLLNSRWVARNIEKAKARVREYVAHEIQAFADDHASTVRELAKIARANIADYVAQDDETGELVMNWAALDKDQIAGLTSVPLKGGGRLVLSDKIKALDLLAKIHKLLDNKLELTGPNGQPFKVTLTREDSDL